MDTNYSVSNEVALEPSYKEKYQNKLQKIVTEIISDPESNNVIGRDTVGTQQEYVLTAIHYLIENDKTDELMRVLVDNFGDDLQYM